MSWKLLLITCCIALVNRCDGAIRVSLDASRENATWIVRNSNGSIEIPAQVPGGIYTDLQAAGILDQNLFYRFNDHEYRWVANEEWTYETTFLITPEILNQSTINLIFHGLDTVGEIYVNSEFVASVDNMFVRYVVAVQDVVIEGTNTLQVRFKSPIKAATESYEIQTQKYLIPPACIPDDYQGECHVQQLRKMQASFAWDWGPAFPSIGIWKSVEIEAFNKSAIRDIEITTTFEDGNWYLNVTMYIVSATDELPPNIFVVGIQFPSGAKLRETSVTTESITTKDDKQNNTFIQTLQMSFFESEIRRWWPNGYGEQVLYYVYSKIISVPEFEDEDMKEIYIGFREVELVEEPLLPDKDGLSFYFKVNGIPIFAKGANWIPGHILPELSYDKDIIRHALLSAKEANMNMIRVWGGGLYESDYFYQTADELGILIWQDFMFASAMYPADDEFLQSVAVEAEQQIRRLQHHTSLAIWAGNNENEGCLASNYFGTDSNYTLYKGDYVKLNVEVIGSRVVENDPSRYFAVSCPSNGIKTVEDGYVADNPGSAFYGDVHHYNYNDDPWDSTKYPDTRFASEYGFQSWPSFKTLSQVSIPEDWNMNSEFCKQRQHHPGGLSQITHLIKFHFPLPEDDGSQKYFETYIYYNQISQALAVKTESEKYRRDRSKLTSDNKGHTMGALYWMLNDVWQGPSWSSIEYGGRWKILHYYAKKFFAPVLVSPVKVSDTKIDVYIVSDLVNDVPDVNLTIRFYNWDSFNPILEQSSTFTLANSSSAVYKSLQLPDLEPNTYFIHFELNGPDNLQSINVFYPTPFTEAVNLQPAKVSITQVTPIEDSTDIKVTLTTDTVAPFVWLETDAFGQFEDNGFTLHVDTIDIRFSNRNQTVDFDLFKNTLTVRSLLS